jgi:hypothetical protein
LAKADRGDGFFVFVLAVKDGSQSLAWMHIDGIPNVLDTRQGYVASTNLDILSNQGRKERLTPVSELDWTLE